MSYGRIWAEIDLGKLALNYKKIKKSCKDAKILAPIKADAYGHGAIEVGRSLEEAGIFMLGVASVEEGIELRKGEIKRPILVLSPIPFEEIDAIFEYHLRPTVSDIAFFNRLKKRTELYHRTVPIHIEVDTGMTRTGLPYDAARKIIARIAEEERVVIEGVFTHFPIADADHRFSQHQVHSLVELKKGLAAAGIVPKFFHIANTAGILRVPNACFNLVRPGICLYGLLPNPKMSNQLGLEPVLSLRSKVVNMRRVPSGTKISYGHTYKTKGPARIATISAGYGDGYPRSLSRTGEVIIKGRRAPIVGTICMDLLMVDVTSIPQVRVNDTVTLIGREKKEEITASELAERAKTIVYEIICGIGPRVPRVYYDNHKFIRIRNLLLRGLV